MKPFVMGSYPMAKDETVRFAVIDFDEAAWRRDSLHVVRKARALGLSAAMEKSRSGKGAHLWFFFEGPILAKKIRAVLTYVMTLVLEEHPEVGLNSYDRIIPNQDTLPRGGFGNLIALPLQADARASLGDAEHYRRARREDFLLQEKGYRVLRFLNEDICARLDAVLDSVQSLPNAHN